MFMCCNYNYYKYTLFDYVCKNWDFAILYLNINKLELILQILNSVTNLILYLVPITIPNLILFFF